MNLGALQGGGRCKPMPIMQLVELDDQQRGRTMIDWPQRAQHAGCAKRHE
jgi:hypothetical protein